MSLDSNPQSTGDGALPENAPPVLATPPLLPANSNGTSSSARQLLALILNLFLVFFLADALISLADDSLQLFCGIYSLVDIRMLVGLACLLGAVFVYGLMILTPLIPKRFFIPLTLLCLLLPVLGMPVLIGFYGRPRSILWIDWAASCLQVLVGLWVLAQLKESGKPFWRLMSASRLTGRGFSWRNLIGSALANILGLTPALLIYLFISAGVLINHFTDGFLTLHPGGFTMEARTYIRDDGKTIQLFPMSHVAEADFYQKISQTFPTNSIILMEGVTDEKNLLTNGISYKRMAKSLGLTEQHEAFKPNQGKMIRADIDVDQFSTNTLTLLNLVMLIHAQGVNAQNVQTLLQYSPRPDFQDELFGDLIGKRNRHLMSEIQSHLTESKYIVVPWGVAHMPGIAEEVKKSGFHLISTQPFTAIRFFHFN